MDTERFKELIRIAVKSLHIEFIQQLQNVDILVSDYPTSSQVRKSNLEPGHMLLGLYEGIPQTKRNSGYSLVLPDKITIFQKPIESLCSNDEQIVKKIKQVVHHEIAHHFGISDERLNELGR